MHLNLGQSYTFSSEYVQSKLPADCHPVISPIKPSPILTVAHCSMGIYPGASFMNTGPSKTKYYIRLLLITIDRKVDLNWLKQNKKEWG